MDPASIVGLVASCTSLIVAVGKSSVAIHSFVRSCRDARKELAETARQLVELEMVVNLIKDDFAPFTHESCQRLQMPDSLATEIPSIVANCSMVLTEFDTIVGKYGDSSNGVKWTLSGREKAAALNKQLDAHVRCLNLALDFFKLSITKAIHNDTQQLIQENAVIKDNVVLLPGIKDQLDELRDQVENLPGQLMGRGVVHQPPGFALQRWLDTATGYYEHSVADGASIYDERPTAASDSGDEGYEEELLALHEDTRAPVRNQAQDELRDTNSLDAQIRTHLTEGHEVVPQSLSDLSSSLVKRKSQVESSDSDAQSQDTIIQEVVTQTHPLQNDPQSVQANLDPDILVDSTSQLHDGTALRAISASSRSCYSAYSLSGLSLGGQFLAFQSQRNFITVIETSTGQQVARLSLPDYSYIPIRHTDPARSPCIMPTPNGRALLFHCGKLVPRLYCVSTNREFCWDSSPGHNKERRVQGGQFGISPDGRFVVVYSRHWSNFSLKQMGAGFSDPRLSIWAINYDFFSVTLLRNYKLKKDLNSFPSDDPEFVTSVGFTPNSQTTVLTVGALDVNHATKTIRCATRALFQTMGRDEWCSRALSIPGHEARFVNHSSDLSPEFEKMRSQTAFQTHLPVDLVYRDFSSSSFFHCFDIYGKKVGLDGLEWIVKAEYGAASAVKYGAVSPVSGGGLWVVWISSCGFFVATVFERAKGTKVLFSIWHMGSKRLIFGPHDIGQEPVGDSGFHSGFLRVRRWDWFSVHVKADVVAVQCCKKLWYWKFDRNLE